MSEPLFNVDDVTVAYGPATILHDVTVSVAPGEVVAVLGANGSGKSTLIKAALGLAPITRGEAHLFGAPISTPRAVPFHRIGYVPQRAVVGTEMPTTALEVVLSGAIGERRLRPRRGAKAAAMEALDRVNLADRALDPVRVFSGGQMQRTMIARALIRGPELMILDEPLAGIDANSQELLLHSLRALHADGAAIVVVLHDIGGFAGFLNRSIVLAQGAVRYDGPPPRTTGASADHHMPIDAGPPSLAPDLSWG